MNKRIKELWEQSQTRQEVETFTEGIFHTRVTDNYKKFAELIISECANLTLDYKNAQYYAGWLDYRKQINKHFGIE